MNYLNDILSEKAYSIAAACLLNHSFKKFKASDVACAILFFVRRQSKIRPVWRIELSEMTCNDPSNPAVVEVLSLLNDTIPVPIEEQTPTYSNMDSKLGAESLVTPSKQTNKENVTPQHESNTTSKCVVSPDSIADLVSALGL